MATIKSRVSYLKGLMDGLKMKADSSEGRLFTEIVKVLDEIGEEVDTLKEKYENMEEYISALDEDLQDVEEDYYGYDDEMDECICEDDFVEIQCSECEENIFIDKSILKNKENVKCPNCNYALINNDNSKQND